MEKDLKNPPEDSTRAEAPDSTGAQPADAGQGRGGNATGHPLHDVAEEVKAQVLHTQGFLKLDYFTLFWIFVGGCVIGLAVETLFHAIVYGGYESRAGLVWGPFSSIYGVAAIILTLFLNRFYHSHNLVIFLVSMALGSAIEYVASWGMEHFWGAVAWDYTGTFGSINGRTNFAFGVMWGMLGLVWVRSIIPLLKHVFDRIGKRNLAVRAVTVLMSIFMIANCLFTVLALDRQSQRAAGVPATNAVQGLMDEWFPDSYMEARFQNMSVYGRELPEAPAPPEAEGTPPSDAAPPEAPAAPADSSA